VAYVSLYGPRARTTDAGDIGIPASDLLATFAWLARVPGVSDRSEVNDQVVATLKK
jgi:hypothetical protein